MTHATDPETETLCHFHTHQEVSILEKSRLKSGRRFFEPSAISHYSEPSITTSASCAKRETMPSMSFFEKLSLNASRRPRIALSVLASALICPVLGRRSHKL